MRDYIAYEIQRVRPLIDEVKELGQAETASYGRIRKEAEGIVNQKCQAILKESHAPSAIYQFLVATKDTLVATKGTKEANTPAKALRTTWQSDKSDLSSKNGVIDYYKKLIEAPTIDLVELPVGSFVIQFAFTLAQPYISRDEQNFYIIDNPIRKDKVLGLPYVASTSWKGSLRAALWKLSFSSQDEAVDRLCGNEKHEEEQEKFHAGRLHFFPTFFTQKSLEIINPHDRERRIGTNLIFFESVPGGIGGAIGNFTLLYVPFDCIGEDKKVVYEQIAQDLSVAAKGLQAMFRIYGFGAKTSSGFGYAKEAVAHGSLRLRVKIDEAYKVETAAPSSQPSPPLPRYLEAPDRLKLEYLTSEGTFRERTEAELKRMSKADRQVYDKAKNWWHNKRKQLAEASKQATSNEQAAQETQLQAKPIVWPTYSFEDFAQLVECAKERAEELRKRGGM